MTHVPWSDLDACATAGELRLAAIGLLCLVGALLIVAFVVAGLIWKPRP